MPDIVSTVEDLRAAITGLRRSRRRIGLVPTMGALHAGHLALVEAASRHADAVVATIFVNPKQFAPTEDLSRYPRPFEADIAALAGTPCDLVYAPDASAMYPQGFSTTISLQGPAAAGLEDAFRPTHFAGVATVVAKLFIQSGADLAMFGEKDFQQLAVIRQMARDLDLPIEVLGLETVRETDGLAMSSRNRYLSNDERATAPLLHRVMERCAEALRRGAHVGPILAEGREAILRGGFRLDYLEARDPETLAPTTALPMRLLVAAHLGKTRLIDNMAV